MMAKKNVAARRKSVPRKRERVPKVIAARGKLVLHYDRAKQELQSELRLEPVKEIADKAEAMRRYLGLRVGRLSWNDWTHAISPTGSRGSAFPCQ
jgi:hypothetical protein